MQENESIKLINRCSCFSLMCGITGFNWQDKAMLKKATDTIKHRGPDQSGYYSDKNVSLGHRRLSIIDLSENGRQPMSSQDGNLWIIFNGEVYNFQDIKEDLKGCRFKSHSDTEVILYAYEKFGLECFSRFNGMWALCIYDVKEKKLILSRDRAGKKPLYYYWDGKKFIFGSEIKAILAHGIKKEINKEALDFYLTSGYITSPSSIYKNVFKLEPRQTLVFDLAKKSISKSYYYELPKYRPSYDRKMLVEKGRELLKDATRLRMIADVPVGAFLSGGLDSSAVVAAMSEFTDISKLHTFSIGFDGKYDETEYMEIVRKALHTKHHHMYFKEDSFHKLVDRISYYYDEPFCDTSMFPTYEVSRLAREHVTVSLSGDGGDEIFGGYETHRVASIVESLRRLPKGLRKMLYSAIPDINIYSPMGKIKEALRLSIAKPEDFYADMGVSIAYKSEAYRKWSSDNMKKMLELSNDDFVEAVIKYDLFYNSIPDNFLVKVDRASMAHALEARCPFLDYRFIEYSSTIPVKWKVSPFRTKILMREVIKEMLPKKIVNRGKKGFAPPIREWISKPRYSAQVSKSVEFFYKNKIIDESWYDFYKNKVMLQDNQAYRNYRIRMLILWKWWQQWMR
jgi:asparagine synthase (glutamine-hydrolysing)